MKTTLLVTVVLVLGSSCVAQDKSEEIVFLHFENNSDATCDISEEQQGRFSGKTETKKYKKISQKNGEIHFYICKELFIFSNNKAKEILKSDYLKNIKFSAIKDLINQVHESNPLYPDKAFDKIYIIEKISDKKITKYKVKWQYYIE